MSKLSELQAIQAGLIENNNWSHGQANEEIARLLVRKVNTIESWLSVNQTRPIPDDALKLLKLCSA